MDVQQAIRDAVARCYVAMDACVDDHRRDLPRGQRGCPVVGALIDAALADARAQGKVEAVVGQMCPWVAFDPTLRPCRDMADGYRRCAVCSSQQQAEAEAARTAAALRELVEG